MEMIRVKGGPTPALQGGRVDVFGQPFMVTVDKYGDGNRRGLPEKTEKEPSTR
jgi:hypothetical protein